MKRFLAAAALSLSSVLALAQTTVITASNERLSGANITVGTASFTPVNALGTAIPFTDGNGDGNGPTAFVCQMTNGAITGQVQPDGSVSGVCAVPSSNLSTPAVLYVAQVCDTSTGLSTSGQCWTSPPIAGISGADWALDHYAPATAVATAQAYTFTTGTGAPPTSCTAPAIDVRVNNGGATESVCYNGVFLGISGLGGAGATGPAGPQGIQGPAGPTGMTGSPGAVGATGPQGPIGLTGATGAQGPAGAGGAGSVGPQGPIGLTGATGPEGPSGATGPAGATGGNGTASAAGSLGAVQINGTGTALGASFPVQEFKEVPNPTLASWYEALHSCKDQVVNVVIHGDSRSIVDTTVVSGATSILTNDFAHRWANRLQTYLQGACGSHGSGLVPFLVSADNASFNLDYYTQPSVTESTTSAIGPYQSNAATTVVAASGTSITFTAHVSYDHLNMYCASGPGLNPWTISIDGYSSGTCGGSASSLTATLSTTAGVSLGTHSATITCPTGPCDGYGVEATAGTTGVSIHNLSVGSAAAEIFGQYPSTQYAYSDLIPGGQDLDIIAMISNEPGVGISTSQFQTTLNNMISHDRALAAAPSVLMVALMQDSINGQAPYYPILPATAQAQNTAYIDFRDRWGASEVPAFYAPNGQHENNLGNGEEYAMVLSSIVDVPTPPASGVAAATCNAGSYMSGITAAGTILCTAGAVGGSGSGSTACGSGYAHSAQITVASSRVVGGADLLNYPIMLTFNGASANSITLANLKGAASGGQVQSTSGLDVIFCSASGVQLSHELVAGSYVPSTGAGEWYVKIPDLSASAPTVLTAFWDNSGASDTSNHTDVWSNGYTAVYHYGGTSNSASFFADSTANGNTLTGTGSPVQAAGDFGGAAQLSASMSLVNSSPVNLPTGGAARTLEMYVQIPGASVLGSNEYILGGYGSGTSGEQAFSFNLSNQGANGEFLSMWDNGANGFYLTPDTNWHQYVAELPAAGLTAQGSVMYMDGAPQAMVCLGGCATAYDTTASPAEIRINGIPVSPGAFITENVDETRISNVGRSSGWLATEYANQSNPAAFFTVGAVN